MDYSIFWTIGKWVGGVSLTLLVLGGIALFVLWKYSGKKHKFLLYSKDGLNVSIVGASIRANKDNKSDRKFYFPDNQYELEIRKPTRFMNGKPYREITYDQEGKYCYLEGTTFNEDKLNLTLKPEEKQIALFRLKEYQERYKDPIDKMGAISMIMQLIMVFIIAGGCIFCFVKTGTMLNTISEVVQETNKNAEITGETTAKQLQIMEMMAVMQGMEVDGNGKLMRQLS